jgi:hypothetical protein
MRNTSACKFGGYARLTAAVFQRKDAWLRDKALPFYHEFTAKMRNSSLCPKCSSTRPSCDGTAIFVICSPYFVYRGFSVVYTECFAVEDGICGHMAGYFDNPSSYYAVRNG